MTTRYGELLRRLLPPGRLFTADPDSNLSKLLEGLAAEFERVDRQASALPEQLDPSRGALGVADWERVLGLPDSCGPTPETFSDRRAAILGRLLAGGSLSAPFYYQLARALGYSVAFESGTDTPFVVDESVCGDALGSDAAIFNVTVRIAGGTTTFFVVGESVCGDYLDITRDEFLECVLLAAAPAHVALTFTYAGPNEYYLEVTDEEGGLVRVFAFGNLFYVRDENGDLIQITLDEGVLYVRDENGDLVQVQLQQEAP